MEKFIQITAFPTTPKQGSSAVRLFALDDAGDIWVRNFDDDFDGKPRGRWKRLDKDEAP